MRNCSNRRLRSMASLIYDDALVPHCAILSGRAFCFQLLVSCPITIFSNWLSKNWHDLLLVKPRQLLIGLAWSIFYGLMMIQLSQLYLLPWPNRNQASHYETIKPACTGMNRQIMTAYVTIVIRQTVKIAFKIDKLPINLQIFYEWQLFHPITHSSIDSDVFGY